MAATLDSALASIPDGLRKPLVSHFEGLLSDYRSGRWEGVGLKAGKLCEIVYTIISGHVAGTYADAPSKPSNMVAACLALENASPTTFSRSVRIQIPRMLVAVYDLRNNRAIGHVGGDVDPNHMDAELFLRASKWLIAELIRIFGALDIDKARNIIESVTDRTIPAIWEGGGTRRILNPGLPAKDKALTLAYSSPSGVSARNLAEWSGYKNLSRFKRSILTELEKNAYIHYDKRTDVVIILPPGIRRVEAEGFLILK